MKIMIIISFMFLGCLVKINKMDYFNAILGIESRTGELVTSGTLFNDTIFLHIFKYPDVYKEDAIAFLADSVYTEQQKIISVFSMQDLTTNNYIDYTSKCFVLYKQNKITANTLRIVLSSDIKSGNLKKAYKDKRFLSIVKDVYNAVESTTRLKKMASTILENH